MNKEEVDELIKSVSRTGNEEYFEELLRAGRSSSIKSNIAIGISIASLIATIVIGVLTLLK